MDQNINVQTLGQRIVSAARLAVELHLALDNSPGDSPEFQQRDVIGGTDPGVRCTGDGCGHAGLSGAHPVTDDALQCGGR